MAKKQPNEPALIRREEAMLKWAWLKYCCPNTDYCDFDYNLFSFEGIDDETVPFAVARYLPPEDVPAVLNYWRERLVADIDALVAKAKARAAQRAQLEQAEMSKLTKPKKPKQPKPTPDLNVVANGQGGAR